MNAADQSGPRTGTAGASITRRTLGWGLTVLAYSLALGCAPLPPSPTRTRRVQPPPAKPRGVNWRSQNHRGELVLPHTVEVQLTALDRGQRIDLIDGTGHNRQISVVETPGRPRAILVDGQSDGNGTVTIRGPVMIGERRHDGTLMIRLHAQGGLSASVRLPLETYIMGVVAAELPIWSAEPAELEAQAIAARTYAAATIAKRCKDGEPASLTDGVLDQAYHGTYDGSASRGSQAVAAKLRAAIAQTGGQVVIRGDRLEETRYHAACGGHTANFAEVFTNEATRYDAHGPSGRACASCLARAKNEQASGRPAPSRPLSWVVTLEAKDLEALGEAFQLGGPVHRIEAARTDVAGRWLDVRLIAAALGAAPALVRFDDVRRALGYSRIKSAVIDALAPAAGHPIPAGSQLRIQGRGRGHGVGLCQEGAREYARSGRTSEQILQHYYPGTTIRRVQAMEMP